MVSHLASLDVDLSRSKKLFSTIKYFSKDILSKEYILYDKLHIFPTALCINRLLLLLFPTPLPSDNN